ncbi:hypothetical protein GPECTOR_32g518 [Gonium pectorale]|uniref:Uncharacterized protein n=1 Tax=Gonium pectorale TaxID=33097 RepID=A0A150GEA0_GONPE|nr:hypothetical protein GPECTOR_32g518 [Gonium pectorale]|eukprot:KXZ47905.1 hypothetical protein GPECTOR_32g518 [Gonium pectorale]
MIQIPAYVTEMRCDKGLAPITRRWKQVEARARNAPPDTRAAAALDWIKPCVDTGVVSWLSRVFNLIPAKMSRVEDSDASLGARRNAVSSLKACGPSAFMLLEHLVDQLRNLLAADDAQQKARVQQQVTPLLLARDFMAAAAAAFRAWTLFTAYLALHPTREALEAGGGYDASSCFDVAAGTQSNIAMCACTYSRFGMSLLCCHLSACGVPTEYSAGAAAARLPARLPAPIAEIIDALCSSGLVPAAAGMVLQAPLVDPLPSQRSLEHSAAEVRAASGDLAQVLFALYNLRMRLIIWLGCTSAPVVALGRLLGSREVTALRHAMLQRLAAHGGLQPPPPAGEAEAAEAGAPKARAWWLTHLELQRGAVVNVHAAGGDGGGDGSGKDTVGWLEGSHCFTVLVSLGFWRWMGRGMIPSHLHGSLPPPLGAPPPLALARLAARTAEAICRLYRGQGLGGAYGPGAPEWLFARNAGLMSMFDFSVEAEAAPEAEARACLPHWLEAAAWGLALGGEALAGAVERRGGVKPNIQPGNDLAAHAQIGREAEGLSQLLQAVSKLTVHPERGVRGLSEQARADLSDRLHRADLGASLDRTLRLALTLVDRVATPGAAEWERSAAKELRSTACKIAALLHSQLLPMLKSDRTASGVRDGASAAGSDGDDASGVLVTAAKRAFALARQLEELTESGGGGGALQHQLEALLTPASNVLKIVVHGVFPLWHQLQQRQQKPAAEDGPTPDGGPGAAAAGACPLSCLRF